MIERPSPLVLKAYRILLQWQGVAAGRAFAARRKPRTRLLLTVRGLAVFANDRFDLGWRLQRRDGRRTLWLWLGWLDVGVRLATERGRTP